MASTEQLRMNIQNKQLCEEDVRGWNGEDKGSQSVEKYVGANVRISFIVAN